MAKARATTRRKPKATETATDTEMGAPEAEAAPDAAEKPRHPLAGGLRGTRPVPVSRPVFTQPRLEARPNAAGGETLAEPAREALRALAAPAPRAAPVPVTSAHEPPAFTKGLKAAKAHPHWDDVSDAPDLQPGRCRCTSIEHWVGEPGCKRALKNAGDDAEG